MCITRRLRLGSYDLTDGAIQMYYYYYYYCYYYYYYLLYVFVAANIWSSDKHTANKEQTLSIATAES